MKLILLVLLILVFSFGFCQSDSLYSNLINADPTFSNSWEIVNNKGRLPIPVFCNEKQKNDCVCEFSVAENEIRSDDTLFNQLSISCNSNAIVISVAEGYVVQIINVKETKALLLQHGNYYTLYSGLSQVFVTTGQQIKSNQPIGFIEKNNNTLIFQIWKEFERLNPTEWVE